MERSQKAYMDFLYIASLNLFPPLLEIFCHLKHFPFIYAANKRLFFYLCHILYTEYVYRVSYIKVILYLWIFYGHGKAKPFPSEIKKGFLNLFIFLRRQNYRQQFSRTGRQREHRRLYGLLKPLVSCFMLCFFF